MTTTRPSRPVVLLRPVPGTSPIHGLWAGTKLVVVFVVSLLLAFYPGWSAIGLVTLLVAVAIGLARIPLGAVPSIPWYLWALIALGGITAALAGGAPVLQVWSVHFGLGGLLRLLSDLRRNTGLTVVVISHDFVGLEELCPRTLNLSDGVLTPAVGDVS